MNVASSWPCWRTARRAALLSLFLLCACETGQPVRAPEADIKSLRAAIEGVYVLDELHTDTGVFRPPKVEGRFVLLNDTVVFSFLNRVAEGRAITVIGHGTYVLAPAQFSYGYDSMTAFTQTDANTSVSNTLPWEGKHVFAARREGDSVALRSATEEEILIGKESLRYSLKGKLLRVWRRVPSAQ